MRLTEVAGLTIVMVLLLAGLACEKAPTPMGGPIATAAPHGMATSADGVAIHYHTAGQGEPALVFVHGWSCDGSYWKHQVEPFAANHQVVTIDLAGHGESGTARETWSIPAFGADVKAVVDHLGLERVVLIGHSLGGPVIAEAAIAMPERVVALIGIDNLQRPKLDMPREQADAWIDGFRTDFAARMDQFARSLFVEGTAPELVEQVAADMGSAPPETAIPAVKGYIDWYETRSQSTLGQLPAPLRCINSDMYATDTEAMSALIEDYGLHLLPGIGHFPMLEDPERFNHTLAEVIAVLPD